ncbi:MAG TPA: SdrD B-like domain-containing protein [Solirubrobacteraceae bacterium]|nr:SdrD B-like domain-containing protein [Solirubrobacteraceae bacterium]
MDRSNLARTRGRHGALIALLAVLLCGALAGVAQAVPLVPTDAPLPGSDFQGGDGNQDATALLRDWQSIAGSPGLVSADDPNALDTTFDTGSHENDPLHWDISLDPDGVTPGKANFFNSWSFIDEREDTFLYLSFDREDSGGNVFLAFELNQDTRSWINASGDAIQCRTSGDIIVSYEIQNDDNVDVIVQQWVSDSEVSAAEAAAGLTNGEGCSKTGHFVDLDLTPDQVQGAINRGTSITNYLPRTPPAGTLGEELFGEAALNLTAIFEDLIDDPCFSFGQISLHGRASESSSASMQDLVGPVPLLVRNCTASGTKYHDIDADGVIDAGEPTIAGWKLYVDLNNNNQLDAGEPTTLTDADGDYTFEDLSDGTFTIREAPDAAQAAGLKGFLCSFPSKVDANCEHSVTIDADHRNVSGKDFANYRKAVVKVEKQTLPDGAAGSFAFTSTLPGKASFSLSDNGTNSTTVDPGVYTATETPHPGFSLTDIACSGDTILPNSSDAGATATFNVQSGETITCVFTNTRDATVTVVKDAVPDDPQDFSFSTSGLGAGFDLDDDGDAVLSNSKTFTVSGTDFGTKTVTEAAQADWTLTDITCTGDAGATDAGRTATLDVDPGETIVCTFTNARDTGKLTVEKELISDDPKESGRFHLRIGDETVATGGDGASGARVLPTGAYVVSELGAGGTELAHYDSSIVCVDGEETVAGPQEATSISVDVGSEDDIVCTITNEAILNPDIEVDKKIRNVTLGGQLVDTPPDIDAYVGDTLEYQFSVTNPGNVALAVTVVDPRCDAAPVRTQRQGDDELLDPGETWVYVCSHVVTAADPDPLPNTVTATGTVPGRPPVTDEDKAQANILHPAIDIEKTGPATAAAGAVLTYTLAVTNPGDVEFASDKVVVTDPGCDDQPTLTSKNGDPTPAFLNPGDNWTYVCSHATAAGQTSFLNTAKVTGKDRNGRDVSDSDDFPTTLSQQQVLPQPAIVSGAARLRGPSGCIRGPFTATVRGSRIARVTFFVDGKRFKRINAAGGEGTKFTVKINPKGRGFGVHRVTARVVFAAAAQTSARTLRLSFQRCRKQVVRPRFTG